jgi:hypothetical protein
MMMAATTTWLIDKATLVAVRASLPTGQANEAMSPTIASARKAVRGRLAHSPARGGQRGAADAALEQGGPRHVHDWHSGEVIADWGAHREHGAVQVLGGIPAKDLAVFSAVLEQVLARLRAAYHLT